MSLSLFILADWASSLAEKELPAGYSFGIWLPYTKFSGKKEAMCNKQIHQVKGFQNRELITSPHLIARRGCSTAFINKRLIFRRLECFNINSLDSTST